MKRLDTKATLDDKRSTTTKAGKYRDIAFYFVFFGIPTLVGPQHFDI